MHVEEAHKLIRHAERRNARAAHHERRAAALVAEEERIFAVNGNPVVGIGIDDVLKPLRESLPHLFKTENKPNGYNPAGGSGSGGIVNPWKKESFNMTEQGKILKNDPVQAKQLASAAGITLNI